GTRWGRAAGRVGRGRLPLARGRSRGLAGVRPPVHALDRPDVEVLTRMRAGHDRQLGRLEIERLDPARLDQGDDAERLDAAAEIRDAIRVAEAADEDAVDVDLADVAPMDALDRKSVV